MLTAAALVPVPPLLVPELAGGSAPLDEELRQACLETVRVLEGSGAERIVVVGSTPLTHEYTGSWDFRAWGAAHPPDAPAERLPLSLAVGDWLLDTAGSRLPRTHQGVIAGPGNAPLGEELVSEIPTALLVCGGGSACRDVKAPGHFDPRAEAFDVAVEAAVRAADSEALLSIDPVLADELLVDGLAGWQVLAGATAQGEWTTRVCYAAAPYGVFYLSALWLPAGVAEAGAPTASSP